MEKQFIDTQVLSYSYKGNKNINIDNMIISSVVASEFLTIQSILPTKANYYLPLPSSRHRELLEIDHKFIKESTDNIIFDFGNDYNSFIDFSHFAITKIINEKQYELYNKSIEYLNKEEKKKLKRKFRYLINSNLKCEVINESDIEKAYELLYIFREKYNFKVNFRNSWNDLLILSKSINSDSNLITQDSLLNKFAIEILQIKYEKRLDGLLEVNFKENNSSIRKNNKESKGFINQGWKYIVNRK